MQRSFTYAPGSKTTEHIVNDKCKANATTNLVNKIEYTNGKTISYEYDKEERIRRVADSDGNVTEYAYDARGQLLTETLNGAIVNTMTYDGYGNIQTKNGIAYTYDSIWKDKLVKVGNDSITYDAAGNPVNYFGHTVKWENGSMTSFDSNTYKYNCGGIRTLKIANGIIHSYELEGSAILSERWNNHELIPLYDTQGSVYAVVYDKEAYYFIRNLQGDVISVTDKNGSVCGSYSYDAWGKCTVLENKDGIAEINPFRYRGYYYDSETGLYYLNARYYDPETGRFISADDTSYLEPENLSSLSLYAYCGNDPVNCADKTGHFAISLTILGLIIGAIVGATIGGFTAYKIAKDNGAEGWELVGWTSAGILGGGLIGGAVGAGVGALVTKVTGMLGLSIIKGNVFVITKTMVLGHYGYAAVGASLGYGYYEISNDLYNSMTNIQRWLMNSQFLHDCYKLGANFLIAATRPISPMHNGNITWLYYEIAYLIDKGYKWLEDLTALVK